MSALSTVPGVIHALRAARARIADSAAYTAESLARTARGRPTMPESPLARGWSAHGALLAEAAGSGRVANNVREAVGALAMAAEDLHRTGVVEVEHRHGHAGALAVYDRAIALTEAGSRP